MGSWEQQSKSECKFKAKNSKTFVHTLEYSEEINAALLCKSSDYFGVELLCVCCVESGDRRDMPWLR